MGERSWLRFAGWIGLGIALVWAAERAELSFGGLVGALILLIVGAASLWAIAATAIVGGVIGFVVAGRPS